MASIKALDTLTPAELWREVPLQPEADPPLAEEEEFWEEAAEPPTIPAGRSASRSWPAGSRPDRG
jgi:hypothetical protein